MAYARRVNGDAGPRAEGFTAKGARTRAKIVAAAAALMYERGVTATTMEDIRVSAGVSGSQLSHYFTDKRDLVRAVIAYQAALIVGAQQEEDFGTPDGVQAWRDHVMRDAKAQGGSRLGSIGAQVAESDPLAREQAAAGFQKWAEVMAEGLQTLYDHDGLPEGVSPEDMAVTLLAALQGGLLLAQVQRDLQPLRRAIDTLLSLATREAAPGGAASPGLG